MRQMLREVGIILLLYACLSLYSMYVCAKKNWKNYLAEICVTWYGYALLSEPS